MSYNNKYSLFQQNIREIKVLRLKIDKVVKIATALTKLIVKILDIFNAKPDTGISFGQEEIEEIGGYLGDIAGELE